MNRLIALLVLALLLLASPIAAQDATPEPVAIDAPAVSGDITVESGGQLVIGQTDPAPVAVETQSIDNDTLLIVAVLIVGFISMGLVIARGGKPDIAAANQLSAWQMNREFMAAQERAYQNASAEKKQLIDTVATVVTALAPLTKFLTSDDALARLLRDIQTPGPETPPNAP